MNPVRSALSPEPRDALPFADLASRWLVWAAFALFVGGGVFSAIVAFVGWVRS